MRTDSQSLSAADEATVRPALEESTQGPLEDPSLRGNPGAALWVARVTTGFVALGILVRGVRYLLNFPLWCDETMIGANFLDRGYADLFRPLDYRQVCPLLFLVIELTSVKLLGFSEMTLRLFPAICGIASVPLFRHFAGRILSGVPFLLAVAVFAVSGWPLRYVAEVKPYASDLFAALALLTLAVEWLREPGRTRWLWASAVAVPFAVALSYPAIFIAGGIGIGILATVWRSKRRGTWLAYVAFNLGAVATFLLLLPFYKTAPQDHDYFHAAWAPAFPPLNSLPKLVAWFFTVNTGHMFAYPEGGERGASSLTFLCFVVAAVVLWRRGRKTICAVCLAPFALALVAAAIHRYPYGVSARTMQYVVPMICLFMGLGAATLLNALPSAQTRRRVLGGVAIVLAALGFGHIAFDASHPYKTASDQRARAFAEWFWTDLANNAELACIREDLGIEFQPRHWTRDATDTYLCYQKIYSERHREGLPVKLDAVSEKHPLRCVLFNEMPQKTPEFQKWMQEMLQHYELRDAQKYPVSSIEKRLGPTWHSLYMVYEFVPKAGVAPPLAIGKLERGPLRR